VWRGANEVPRATGGTNYRDSDEDRNTSTSRIEGADPQLRRESCPQPGSPSSIRVRRFRPLRLIGSDEPRCRLDVGRRSRQPPLSRRLGHHLQTFEPAQDAGELARIWPAAQHRHGPS